MDVGPNAAQQEARRQLGASGKCFLWTKRDPQEDTVPLLHPGVIRGTAPTVCFQPEAEVNAGDGGWRDGKTPGVLGETVTR